MTLQPDLEGPQGAGAPQRRQLDRSRSLSHEQEAARLLALYEQSGDPRFRRAAGALARRPGKKKGRRAIDDVRWVEKIVELMSQRGISRWAATRAVAVEVPGHSREAVIRRLYRKARSGAGL